MTAHKHTARAQDSSIGLQLDVFLCECSMTGVRAFGSKAEIAWGEDAAVILDDPERQAAVVALMKRAGVIK